MQKVKPTYAFIDSQNLNLGICDQGWKLDFARFRVYLKDKYKVTKAFLFLGFIEENQKMYDYLENSGYQIIFKPIVKQNGKVKGNVDAELVLHTMIQLNNFGTAVLVTGDGDFHCLIEFLDKKRKLKKLIIPNQKRYSSLLLKYKKYMDFMNNRRYKLGVKGKKNGSVALKTKH